VVSISPAGAPQMVYRDIQSLPDSLRNGAVAIGNFDGVHRGHAQIARRLRETGATLGGAAVVLTFDPPPAALLRPEKAPPPLTTVARKVELLAALGIDAVLAYPTDMALLQLSPQAFFDEIVIRQFAARALVEGTNFCFGHDRAGTIDVLRSLCQRAEIQLEVVEPVVFGGEAVSSSRVRRLIAAGDVATAAELLTQPYRIEGTIERGVGRGASIGFPTANLENIATLLPAQGVYAGVARLTDNPSDAKTWPAAINCGPNPTFGENSLKVEAHLIGCGETLYGQSLAIDFHARLRDIQPFANVEALKEQLQRDVTATLQRT
jgi:riboflavin kinase/FMN adenylyltransferase